MSEGDLPQDKDCRLDEPVGSDGGVERRLRVDVFGVSPIFSPVRAERRADVRRRTPVGS
jgi:hypothetical protein